MMNLVLTTPPITLPITVEEARRQCSIYENDTTFDDLLLTYIAAAVSMLDGHDGHLQRCLEPQTWTQAFDTFSDEMKLTLRPVLEIESLKYFDEEGDLQTVDPSNYVLTGNGEDATVIAASGFSWPATGSGVGRVLVEYTCGYEGETDSNNYASGVPGAIRLALLMLVGHWFANREAVGDDSFGEMPLGPAALLKPYKRIILA